MFSIFIFTTKSFIVISLIFFPVVSLWFIAKIPFSRIGIGFEKLDRAVFDPNKAYDKVAKIGIKPIRTVEGAPTEDWRV